MRSHVGGGSGKSQRETGLNFHQLWHNLDRFLSRTRMPLGGLCIAPVGLLTFPYPYCVTRTTRGGCGGFRRGCEMHCAVCPNRICSYTLALRDLPISNISSTSLTLPDVMMCLFGNPSEFWVSGRIILRYWTTLVVIACVLTRYLEIQWITGPRSGGDEGSIRVERFFGCWRALLPFRG